MEGIEKKTWELWKWELQGEVDEKQAELDVVTWCGKICPYTDYVKEDQYMISLGPFVNAEDMVETFRRAYPECDRDQATLEQLNKDRDPEDDSIFVEYKGTIIVFHRKKA